jgi:hypothetical protein
MAGPGIMATARPGEDISPSHIRARTSPHPLMKSKWLQEFQAVREETSRAYASRTRAPQCVELAGLCVERESLR